MRRLFHSLILAGIALIIIGEDQCWSADVDYLTQVKPLLIEKCSSCHGALKQEAGLRVDAIQFLKHGSESGPALQSKSPEKSLLLQRVSAEDESTRMPPADEGESLTAEEVEIIRSWIHHGMRAPEQEEVLASPQEHWAYQKISRPDLPKSSSQSNPIDAFLEVKQKQASLQPLPKADHGVLLRRVSFDLTGLPPTIEQLQEFQKNSSPEAFESKVNQLLESPQYGERWGRHWMDVWRYSDWYGYKESLRGSQRHIWHWRDWIVESLNEDKPYDTMIVEMLAADEVCPLDQDALRATGFLARNYHNNNRNIWLDATVEHTAKAFLGVTLNCAKCHDHKFDPIAQQEYYTFRAIFEPHHVRTDQVPGERDLKKNGIARAYDKDLKAETFLYQRGDEKFPVKDDPLAANVVKILELPFEVNPIDLPVDSYFPALSEQVHSETLQRLQQASENANKQNQLGKTSLTRTGTGNPNNTNVPPAPGLPETISIDDQLNHLKARHAHAQLKSYEARYAADFTKHHPSNSGEKQAQTELDHTASLAERRAALSKAKLTTFQVWQAVVKADHKDVGALKKVEAALTKARAEEQKAITNLKGTNEKYTSVGTNYPQQSSGRRKALAEWIVHPENPLTARVAINHIWLRHFGSPLINNVFDFGLRSEKPKHADVLDWLASELIENNWSMKHIHRLILTSNTWQRASHGSKDVVAKNTSIDPDNKTYWRANVRRLESEAIRDSLLHVSGQLDFKRGGPDLHHAKGEESLRRSLYYRHGIEKQMLMMTTFDTASPNECYRRSSSVVPQQALALANSQFGVQASRKLAAVMKQRELSNDSEFIANAFLQVLNREPTSDERSRCELFLQQQASLLKETSQLTAISGTSKSSVAAANDPSVRARENLLHVLMNHNDFISIR